MASKGRIDTSGPTHAKPIVKILKMDAEMAEKAISVAQEALQHNSSERVRGLLRGSLWGLNFVPLLNAVEG